MITTITTTTTPQPWEQMPPPTNGVYLISWMQAGVPEGEPKAKGESRFATFEEMLTAARSLAPGFIANLCEGNGEHRGRVIRYANVLQRLLTYRRGRFGEWQRELLIP